MSNPFENPGHNQKAEHEQQEADVSHSADLFDQDEDTYGNRIDAATGKEINNSPATTGADEELSEVEEDPDAEDVLGSLPEEKDAAAESLRKNDPDHKEAA